MQLLTTPIASDGSFEIALEDDSDWTVFLVDSQATDRRDRIRGAVTLVAQSGDRGPSHRRAALVASAIDAIDAEPEGDDLVHRAKPLAHSVGKDEVLGSMRDARR